MTDLRKVFAMFLVRCDFISHGANEEERGNHFKISHDDSELTKDSFILINSAMAEAMEILQGIKKENNCHK